MSGGTVMFQHSFLFLSILGVCTTTFIRNIEIHNNHLTCT